jgi:hypothetical protein
VRRRGAAASLYMDFFSIRAWTIFHSGMDNFCRGTWTISGGGLVKSRLGQGHFRFAAAPPSLLARARGMPTRFLDQRAGSEKGEGFAPCSLRPFLCGRTAVAFAAWHGSGTGVTRLPRSCVWLEEASLLQTIEVSTRAAALAKTLKGFELLARSLGSGATSA